MGTDSMTVNVDIESLAAIVAEAETPRALKASLQLAKIVKQGFSVTVVMTHQSWDAITNNMGLDKTTEMLEQVVHGQATLEDQLSSLTSMVGSCTESLYTFHDEVAALEI